MKDANCHFVSNVFRGNQLVSSKNDAACRVAKAFSIGNLFRSLIKDVERLNSSISIRFAKCNLEVGVKRGECCYFPILTKKQEMVKRVNHGMKTVHHFVAAQLMRGNHFQRTFALSQGWANNSPSGVKISVIASAGCASKGGSGFLQTFACTDNKSGHCCGATRHYPNISLSKKPRRVCILPTHHEYCHPQRSYRADGLNPAWPAIFRQASIVANVSGSDRSRHQCGTKKYMGFLHECIQSCLKGILA